MPSEWKPIDTAPKDRPIIAWLNHEADPTLEEGGGGKLTVYAAHAEGLSHAASGVAIVEWGGAFDDRSYEDPCGGWLPDWWFISGSEFEIAANPTHWLPLPEPPEESHDETL